jgi:hypothetical protein
MTTTVFPCPKCGAVVRLREGETRVQCTGCGSTVAANATGSREVVAQGPGGGEKLRSTVLALSLVVLAGAFLTMAAMRHRKHASPATHTDPTPIYTAPPKVPVVPTPAGELAWEANARAPVMAAVNADAVEDIVGFFRVWDGRSAWVAYAGAFDGATLKPLWRTEAIDPQLVKQPGVVPLALVAGPRVLIADTSPTLRVFTLATGEKQTTFRLSGSIAELCRAPDKASRVWAKVVGDGDTMIDLDTGKSTLAPRPKWCPVPAYRAALPPPVPPYPTADQRAAATRRAKDAAPCSDVFINSVLANAMCARPDAAPDAPSVFKSGYTLTDGPLAVALGTTNGKPFAESRTKASPWAHGFVTDDTKPKATPPAVADLTGGRLYAVYERLYFDAKLAAVDARTGSVLWEAPLVASLPGPEGTGRGDARALVASATRVYVVRAGGGLDVFDASSGKAIGTIGKQ